MLKQIQKKLVDFNYITNEPHDKKSRYNITHYLRNLLQSKDPDVVKIAVDDFLDYFYRNSQKGPVDIYDKTAYFKTAINRLLTELDVPDISFPDRNKKEPITRARLIEVAIEIIELSTIKWTADYETWHIMEDQRIFETPFDDVGQELFSHAINFLHEYEEFYGPLIDRLLALNDAPDTGESIKPQLDEIYQALTTGPANE